MISRGSLSLVGLWRQGENEETKCLVRVESFSWGVEYRDSDRDMVEMQGTLIEYPEGAKLPEMYRMVMPRSDYVFQALVYYLTDAPTLKMSGRIWGPSPLSAYFDTLEAVSRELRR